MRMGWIKDNWQPLAGLVLVCVMWGRLEARLTAVESNVDRIYGVILDPGRGLADTAANGRSWGKTQAMCDVQPGDPAQDADGLSLVFQRLQAGGVLPP